MSNINIKPEVQCFFDKDSNTASYIVIDKISKNVVIETKASIGGISPK